MVQSTSISSDVLRKESTLLYLFHNNFFEKNSYQRQKKYSYQWKKEKRLEVIFLSFGILCARKTHVSFGNQVFFNDCDKLCI